MKTLLSILGSLTIIGSGAATFTGATQHLVKTTTNNSPNENEEPVDSNFQEGKQSDISQFLEEYLSNHPDSQLEADLLSSLVLTAQGVQINLNLLKDYQTDKELYSILASTEFINNLNEMYNQQLLTYDADYQIFSFGDEFQTESKNSSPVWIEIHWYWFGYYKMHFDHQVSTLIYNFFHVGSEGLKLAEFIGKYIYYWNPETVLVLKIIKIVFSVNSWIFHTYDKGKGVWIGYWLLTPELGWGSNK